MRPMIYCAVGCSCIVALECGNCASMQDVFHEREVSKFVCMSK